MIGMFSKRIRILSRVVLTAFLVLFGRLAWLQIVRCQEYRGESKRHAVKRVALESFRGTIFDRRGVVLAVDRPCFDLVVTYRKLAEASLLGVSDVLDWQRLCSALTDAGENKRPGPFARAWRRLSRRRRAAVRDAAKRAAVVEADKKPILKALNRALSRRNLWRGMRVQSGLLSDEAKALLSRNPDELLDEEVLRLNRLVLQTWRPRIIARLGPGELRGSWRDQAIEVARVEPREFDDAAKRITRRVRDMKRYLLSKTGRRFRIREEVIAHPVVRDIGLDAVARFRLHPERYSDVDLRITTKRHYPQGDLAPHVIGYMQAVNADELKEFGREYDGSVEKRYRAHDTVGRTGAERTYNRCLRGSRGERIELVSTEGRRLSKTIIEKPPVPGRDVYLTLDSRVQRAAEHALGSQRGAIVVLQPSTGQILALATSPRYDLRTFKSEYKTLAGDTENAPLLDRSVSGFLPPGSAFKVVTAATGLACGKINQWRTFSCPGFVRVAGVRLRCWARGGHGAMNLHDALVHSCNVYFFETGRRLTKEQQLNGARLFGFGAKVAADIPGEGAKPLPKLRGCVARMNVAAGQGALMTTPLQVAVMIAVIANDGVFVQPYLTSRVVSQDGETVPFALRGEPRRIISRPIARFIKKALVEVVSRGTAKGTGLDRFKVAAKTGTAQTADEERNHAWLAGFTPYDKAQIAFAVVVEGVPGHGGEVAGPVAAQMLQEIESQSAKPGPERSPPWPLAQAGP